MAITVKKIKATIKDESNNTYDFNILASDVVKSVYVPPVTEEPTDDNTEDNTEETTEDTTDNEGGGE